jgi:hypothetical protein
LCVQGAGRYGPPSAYARKQSVITGITQPVLRRIASSTSTIRPMPKAMSHGKGDVLRSVKSSPPCSAYTTVAMASAPASQSHHITRWRKRRATGKTRNERKRTKATWTWRRVCVGTMA